MNQPSRKRLCVFCGQKGVTKEHVWPLWLRAIFADSGSTHIIQSERASGNRNYHGNLLGATVRIVCASCNNGWLSRLEQKSMKLLSNMIRGGYRQLEAADQELLSFWCVKTGLILDRVSSPPTIPPRHGLLIFSKRRPVDHCHIWLTSCKETKPVMSHFLQPMSSEIQGKIFPAYLQTFRIESFTAQILWSESRQAVDSVAGRPDSLDHTHIWPPCNGVVEWPRARITTFAAHEVFARRIITPSKESATTIWRS